MEKLKFRIALLLILVIHSFSGYSQTLNPFWTTRIENVQFADSIIIYTSQKQMPGIMDAFTPLHIDKNIIRLLEAEGSGVYPDNWQSYFAQLSSYLAEGDIRYANNRDKHLFLEVSVLVILHQWRGLTHLPGDFVTSLDYLKSDLVIEISRNAKLVHALYDFYFDTKPGK